MSQILNLRGTRVQNIAEIRTNVIKDQTGNFDILTFDEVSQSVTLHNVEYIKTVSSKTITADDIVTNP